jgi:membrane-associated phospholipid phosphatase
MMMILKTSLIPVFVLTLTAIAPGSAFYQSPKLSVRDEVLEWTLVAGVAAFVEFYFSKTPVWTDHPLLQTKTHGEYKQETISDIWLYPIGLIMVGGIGLMPNSGGIMDREAYIHAKGFIETSFAILPLIDEVVKHIVGKKRPNYDSGMELYAEGKNIDVNDLRKSFWSGQAAMSFGMATYFDLYLLRNVVADDSRSLFWKIPLSMGTCALASYISYTRVTDNLHEPVDVVAGGLAGAIVSSCMYFLNEKRIRNRKIEMEASPGGARLSYDF